MNNILTKSPTKSRMFIWFADYGNGEYLYEFDDKFNEFDSIDKERLKSFGMLGMDMNMKYNISTGVFNICGRELKFEFKDEDDNITKLNDASNNYNDCISYKSAETVLIGHNQGRAMITGYHFGYKTKLDDFNLKIIVHIPLDGKVNIDISLTPNDDIKGTLYIIRNDKHEKDYSLDLVKNKTSNVNWTVV